MKIILPKNQEVEIPDNFNRVAYMSDDREYEICFFRQDLLHLVRYFAFDRITDKMLPFRDFSAKQDWCYDITSTMGVTGLYCISFTLDYDTQEYIRTEYEN